MNIKTITIGSFIGLSMLLMVVACVTISGCTQQIIKHDAIPADKFVFIEHHIHKSGDLKEGNYSLGLFIDFPTYFYYKDTNTLHCYESYNIKNNSDFIAVFGDGESLGDAAGSGAATMAVGFNSTPFNCEHGVRVISINANGTCYIEYNGQNITLNPGEYWLNQTFYIEEKEFANPQTNKNEHIIVNITVNDSIFNYGLINKSNIRF